jgi:hypothetical protein
MRSFSFLLLLLAALVTACGPDALEAGGVSQLRSELSLASAGGCSTAIAADLSEQLIEELNCVQPNLMTNFSGSHVTLYSSVLPWLAPDAARDLKDATTARGSALPISSAYRTLAQQYLLYKWWRAGQCGIQVAAVPGNSNHQSGRAIDTPSYSTWRAALSAQGWRWLGSGDVVHFDHLASANTASKSILAFQRLWNKNNRTGRLSEDGAWGPATESAMARTPTTGFATHGCATTGRVKGIITDSSNAAPLSGVTVSSGTRSVTTTATGLYELELPAGTVTVTATKSGFATAQLGRTVVVGGTVWGSMALTPSSSTGTIDGAVVEKSAPSRPVAGAAVLVGGRMVTTSATGTFTASLPAGRVQLTVSKAGFLTASSQVSVRAGATQAVRIELEASSMNQPPTLELVAPESGASFTVSNVELSGVVSDDGAALTTVRVVQNQRAPLDAAVTAGRFSAPVRLEPGLNTITVTATDSAGLTSSASWTGTFRAGFTGRVHRFDDGAAIIPGAQLTLSAVGSSGVAGAATADDQGRFELDSAIVGPSVVRVVAEGYTTRELTLTVSANERTQLDIGLTVGVEAGIRFIEPMGDGPFDVEQITISGAVTGLEVVSVSVNGQAAMLFGNGFVAKLPLPEGETVFEAVAEGAEGQVVRRSISVVRTAQPPKRTGCATFPGAPMVLIGIALLIVRLRR